MTVVCADIRNYFLKDKIHPETCIFKGEYTISGGILTPSDFLKDGQYIRIAGSDLNDGVWLYNSQGISKIKDETFTGEIWAMSVPQEFVELCDKIATWADNNESLTSVNMSSISSENFGNYGYNKGSGSGSKSGITGAALTWQTFFYDALTPYRRISVL